MNRRNITVLCIIIAILIFAVVALVYPLFGREGLRLGLDLKGGVYLEYQVTYPEGTSLAEQASMIEKAVTIIRTRIDRFGVTEPIVQSVGSERISVQLPGFTDIEQAKKLVEQTGFLEFREVEVNSEGNPVTLKDYLDMTELTFVDQKESGSRIFVSQDGITTVLDKDEGGNLLFLDLNGNPVDVETLKAGNADSPAWIPARGSNGIQLTGSLLTEAEAEIASQTTGTQSYVKIAWNSEGTTIFDQIAQRLYFRTQNTVQRCLGIFLDRELISAPEIQESQYGGDATIQGNFTLEEAQNLATLLASGSLPVPIEKPALYEEVVSATLGANFINLSAQAGIIALILIMLFMIVYYRIPGIMACLALLFYGAVVLAVFKLVPVTLSLAGIGGFVLSLGMAVDANILNFERMKEEIRVGRALGSAIDYGFKRAWLAIRDSNVTTIIACLILFWIGNTVVSGEAVKGFALTLTIGILISMFSALVVTRTLLNLFVGSKISERISLFSTWSGRK